METFISHSSQLGVFPMIHNRLVFGQLAHLACQDFKPDVIAVELPPSYQIPLQETLSASHIAPLGIINLKLRPTTSELANTDYAVRQFNRMNRKAKSMFKDTIQSLFKKKTIRFEDDYDGFDNIVWIFDSGCLSEHSYEFRTNLGGADNHYIYSAGYYKEKQELQDNIISRPIAGRVWFAPSARTQDDIARREKWLSENYYEGVFDSRSKIYSTRSEKDSHADFLVRLAIVKARKYVIVVASDDYYPSDDIFSLAKNRNVTLLTASLSDFLPEATLFLQRNEYDRLTPKEDNFRLYADILQLHSGDAIIEAIRYAMQQPQSNPTELAFIDSELSYSQSKLLQTRRPLSHCGYEELAQVCGISTFFESFSLGSSEHRIDVVDYYREREMAFKLKKILQTGKKVLFFCGAVHWKPIKKHLEEEYHFEPFVPDEETSAYSTRVVCTGKFLIGPASAEFPYVRHHFELALLDNKIKDFSHQKPFHRLFRMFFKTMIARGQSVSNRKFWLFFEFLNRVGVNGRSFYVPNGDTIPQPDVFFAINPKDIPNQSPLLPLDLACQKISLKPTLQELYDCAQAVFGVENAELLLSLALRHPSGCPEGVDKFDKIEIKNGVLVGEINGEEIELLGHFSQLQLLDRREGKGDEIMGDPPPGNGESHPDETTSPEWNVAMAEICLEAKKKAGILIEQKESSELKGVFNGRLDVKATLRNRLKGGISFFFSQKALQKIIENDPYEHFDPVVIIFQEQQSTSFLNEWFRLYLDYQNDYQILYFYGHPQGGGFSITGCVLFVPFLDSQHAQEVKLWIDNGHRKNIPYPNDGYPIPHFAKNKIGDTPMSSLEHQLVAAAASYSRRHIILVSPQSPTTSSYQLAAKFDRRLYYVPLEVMNTENIQKAAILNFSKITR